MAMNKLPAHQLRRVAVEAGCDPRSVVKMLAGEAVQPLLRERVTRALEAHGLGHLVPLDSDGPRAA